MRNFLKMLLAVVCGFILISMISVFVVVAVLGASMSQSIVSLQNNTVLEIELDATIQDRSDELYNYLGGITSSQIKSVGLDELLQAIDNAQRNEQVKAIYLKGGELTCSPALSRELRSALMRFKDSGKIIVAYADNYTQSGYYVASVANRVFLNPSGVLSLKGYALQTVFYKDLLSKLGVEMQVVKVGTYKSAVEPYVLTQMSEPNRLQSEALSQSLWNVVRGDIAESRGITTAVVDSFANEGMMFDATEQTTALGLVDSLVYGADVEECIAQLLNCEDADDVLYCKASELNSAMPAVANGDSEVAVVYAVGAIDGSEQSEAINSKKLSKELLSLADNDDVKAVVLRVNSPGGSAYGSEQIWYALSKVKAKKPLVVSMGGYAASGGYYISCLADSIFAQPNTITGSIGIFGLIPNAKGLTEKIGVAVDGVKTNRFSDMGTVTRPMTSDESALMQAYVERGYELFVKRCADGRSQSVDYIKTIGEGRVWSGSQALEIGLVDALGSVDDAVQSAATLAELSDYRVSYYPAKKDLFTQLMEELMQAKIPSLHSYSSLVEQAASLVEQDPIQARMPYFLMVK